MVGALPCEFLQPFSTTPLHTFGGRPPCRWPVPPSPAASCLRRRQPSRRRPVPTPPVSTRATLPGDFPPRAGSTRTARPARTGNSPSAPTGTSSWSREKRCLAATLWSCRGANSTRTWPRSKKSAPPITASAWSGPASSRSRAGMTRRPSGATSRWPVASKQPASNLLSAFGTSLSPTGSTTRKIPNARTGCTPTRTAAGKPT